MNEGDGLFGREISSKAKRFRDCNTVIDVICKDNFKDGKTQNVAINCCHTIHIPPACVGNDELIYLALIVDYSSDEMARVIAQSRNICILNGIASNNEREWISVADITFKEKVERLFASFSTGRQELAICSAEI